MIGAHFCASSAISLAKASGVPPAGSRPTGLQALANGHVGGGPAKFAAQAPLSRSAMCLTADPGCSLEPICGSSGRCLLGYPKPAFRGKAKRPTPVLLQVTGPALSARVFETRRPLSSGSHALWQNVTPSVMPSESGLGAKPLPWLNCSRFSPYPRGPRTRQVTRNGSGLVVSTKLTIGPAAVREKLTDHTSAGFVGTVVDVLK